MARSRVVVDTLLRAARGYAASGNDAAAAALLGCAATVSRRRHAGRFMDPKLESQLRSVGGHLAAVWPAAPDAAEGSLPDGRRVLHVMTRAYASGGHTRLTTRWIDGDRDAISSIALTQGSEKDAPATLVAAAERTGGAVHHLRGGVIERARQLRSLVRAADEIVLTIHENDVTAVLAIAASAPRPPVVVINHAEHVFWIGASLADVVVNLRPATTDIAVRRRGIPRERCVEVPLPVLHRQRQSATSDARRALGIDPRHKVLLTVGWRYKFTPLAGDDIFAALGPLLAEPGVHLVAVGPRGDDALWSAAHQRYGGRIHAVGPRDSTQPFLDAADVFLDSYPVPSLTAMLEAAMFGLPVVGLASAHAGWPRVLRQDDPALASEIFDDVDAYRRRIGALLGDPAACSAACDALQTRVSRMHGAEAWTAAMENVRSALARAVRERPHTADMQLGSPQTEDVMTATYIADCEDRLIRPELRLDAVDDRAHGGIVAEAMRTIDALLLKPAPPSVADYDAALLTARSLVPLQSKIRALLALRR